MQELDVGDRGPDGSEVESTVLQNVRTKCVIQLLLLGALDSLQVRIISINLMIYVGCFVAQFRYLYVEMLC